MIVKKVPNPNKSASKAVRIRALARYIRAPQTENATEKCLYAGARGFFCGSAEAQVEEMLALARDAPRSRDPIVHYVLSWHADEHPTPAQVNEIIDLLLAELEVVDHQVIYALHADTDNIHLHVMLNRVHPDTLKAVEINGGFDIKALHRACARIEHVQGWRAERNARYRVNAANKIEPVVRAEAERKARPPQRLVDVEHRTGERSAARIAIEEAAPLIEAAKSWEALHEALAERDMRYVRAGSGATLQVGEVFVKASTVSRKATRKRLEARLGPFRAPPAADASRAPERERAGDLPAAANSPLMDPMRAQALIEAAKSWEALHETLAAQGFRYVRKGSGALIVAGEGEVAVSAKASTVSRSAALRQLEARLGPFEALGAQGLPEEADSSERQAALDARHEAWAQREARCEEEARALAERQREERAALRRERCWKGRLLERNLHRSLLAAAHAREKAALTAEHRRAREALREGCFQGKAQTQWLGDPAVAFLWRTRHLEARALEPASETAPSAEAPTARDIGDYHGRAVGSWVVYATRAQHARGEVAFVDRGKRVTLHQRDSDAATLAAMQLAQQKWGRFRARGSEAHKRRAARLAARHGLNLTNPELQGLIAQYRRELGRDRPPPRLRRYPRATPLRPPQSPLAAPALRAPPPEPIPRRPAAVIHPPRGPLADPAFGEPPRVAPRSRSTLAPPPAAPHVEVKLEAPARFTQKAPHAPVRPPSSPRVEAKLGMHPRLTRHESVTLQRPPEPPRVVTVASPSQVPPRARTALAHLPDTPETRMADAPPVLRRREAALLLSIPAPPEAMRTVQSPPRTSERQRTAPVGPPRTPKIAYELVETYGIDAALEAIELARRLEDLEAQYGEIKFLIKPGKVTLLDQQGQPRYVGAHTLTTAARARACRLSASFVQLPEYEASIERALWPDLFKTLDIEHRLIAEAALPDLAVRLRHAVDGQVTRYWSSDYRGEGDSRSHDQWLLDHLAEPLRPRPRAGWGKHDIPASASSQDRLNKDNVSPVRDSKSVHRVASAIASVVTEIARRCYGPEGKPPAPPSPVPPVDEFPGWRQGVRQARHQTALDEYEAETKARDKAVSEALADWRAQAPGLLGRLAEQVRRIENEYWRTRKEKLEKKNRELRHQRRRQYNQIGAQREPVRDHSSGLGCG